MKSSWKVNSVALATAALLFSVAEARAQYGACAPACETPVQACAPSCEAYPTCEATCAAPCEATCEATCGGCYADCYSGCGYNPCNCLSIPAIFDGVCSVVTAPFHWICCGFSDGVFPDCGCAPRPPKSNCNPCDICGNYQGGCNDNCDYSCGSCGPSYESCSPCGSSEGARSTTQGSYNDSYSVGAYDSYAQNMQGAPIFNSQKNFGVQRSVNPNVSLRSETVLPLQAIQANPQRSSLRSVSYEQRAGVFSQAATQGFNRQAVPMQNQRQFVQPQVARSNQNNANVQAQRFVVEQEAQENMNARSFGITRPAR